MRALLLSFISCFTMFLAVPAIAEAESPKILTVGDTIPTDFSAVDSLSRDVTFDSIKGENGLMMMFTRSVDWCQYCKSQIKEWSGRAGEVREKGYSLATISYDSPETLRNFAEENKINYSLLSDTGSSMIDAFGIRNSKFSEGSRFHGIPNPAIYVIDAAGKITYIFREEGFKIRPNIDEVMAALSDAK